MKKSLVAALLVSTTMMSASSEAGFLDIFKSRDSKPNTESFRDVYSGLKFTYLDMEDRLLIVNDFLKTIELEYALLPLKAERISLDYKKLKTEAIALEMLQPNITIAPLDKKDEFAREKIAFLQAQSNMEFMDRMQMLVAQFKDTHLNIQEKVSRPMIYCGLRLFRFQGKIYVGSMEKKFLSMAGAGSKTDFSDIKLGDEVLAIDGVPVEKKIEDLKKYIGGSSLEYVDSVAVRSLTMRNFNYEKKNSITITFKNAGVYKLPIFSNKALGETPRLDAITYFNKYNIPSDTIALGMTYDKATNKWNDSNLKFEGYSVRRLALNLKGVVEYLDDDGDPALRTGYYISKGKTYGVMQLMTFSTMQLVSEKGAAPFLDVIRAFVLELKENGSPLILDLRSNGGGYGNYPPALLSILSPATSITPGPTSGLRMTHYIRQIYEPDLYKFIQGEDITLGATVDEVQAIISDALDNNKAYTPMFANMPIGPDPIVKGFDNKIVALISADCVSACDKTAFLLQDSKRAVLIGTHSNGTGAGFTSSGELNASWEDPLKMFSARIPNYLFGRPGDTV